MERDKIIHEILSRGEDVYIKDDFYDMAIRITLDGQGKESYFRKFTKDYTIHEECPINITESDTAYEVLLGGKFITKDEYDAFDL